MQPDRFSRLVSLSGAAWAVLAVAGVLTGGGEPPEGSASQAKVIAYYAKHSSEIELSAVLFVLAFLFFLIFCGTLRAFLRSNQANEPLATLLLVAGGVITVTAGIGGGVELGLAKNVHDVTPQAAQAINLVSQELFLPVLIGGFLFAICAGLSILRGAQLPRWLGWMAIVMAIAFVIPPIVIAALILLVVWSLVVSILMFARSGGTGAEPAAAVA